MTAAPITLAGTRLLADPSGALMLVEARTLVVSDLHLEKGSALAASGAGSLPPYDSRATLERLDAVLRRWQPRAVVCLGDSFHDADGPARLGAAERGRLGRMVAAHDWIWLLGNHDPALPEALGGRTLGELAVGRLVLRHDVVAGRGAAGGEVIGHYHPKAGVRVRGRFVSGRCFATDGRRLVMPAFGAYAGGLDVQDPAIARLLGPNFGVFLLARERLFAFRRDQLSVPPPDPFRARAS
ncbi:MAG: ligase-associated DNA damage response endonuclease PdeM [Alphaproteobacteria bacterium]